MENDDKNASINTIDFFGLGMKKMIFFPSSEKKGVALIIFFSYEGKSRLRALYFVLHILNTPRHAHDEGKKISMKKSVKM